MAAFFMMPCVYILYSAKLDKYYVGACIEFERRLREHNSGHSKFIRTGMPWVLQYQEAFSTLQEAKERERYIKKQKPGKYIDELRCFQKQIFFNSTNSGTQLEYTLLFA
ncbi:MAG: GIY-YIG nuclease family protein [Terrimonas sp.]|nr:GIY-YIG nuclease family protein [Terrimonas sp.]